MAVWGLEVWSQSGQKIVDNDSFGISFYDEFVVAHDATGSKTYPELNWFSRLYVIQEQQVSGSFTSSTIGNSGVDEKKYTHTLPKVDKFNTLIMTGTVLTGNIPKIDWVEGFSVGGGTNNIKIRVLVT